MSSLLTPGSERTIIAMVMTRDPVWPDAIPGTIMKAFQRLGFRTNRIMSVPSHALPPERTHTRQNGEEESHTKTPDDVVMALSVNCKWIFQKHHKMTF